MSRAFLGEFEQMVLLSILRMGEGAYGLEVRRELEAMSDGLIGGMSVDAQGNIDNTNLRESVWRNRRTV